jgi:UDP-N-acetylglucosamine 2-epimerase (non-hydrolysing)
MKVMTVVGTRPEIIRLSRVISQLGRYFDHVLVNTEQNYDSNLNEIFFKDLELSPAKYNLSIAGGSYGETIANLMTKMEEVLIVEKPDAFLVLGDTHSGLSALVAKHYKIPIFHLEAGNRCFDERVPEEINRRIIDHISDVNLAYSQISREYLLREGLPPDRIVVIGSPMREVLDHYTTKIDASDILHRMKIDEGKYLLVSLHRAENLTNKQNLSDFVESLNKLAFEYEIPIIFPMHPRFRATWNSVEFPLADYVQLVNPLPFTDFVKLQINSFCVLSDSGTISEESSILGFPAVNLRLTHERPESTEEAHIPLSGLKPSDVVRAVQLVTQLHKDPTTEYRKVYDYQANNVSLKIPILIESYVKFVKRIVYRLEDEQ